MYKLDLHTHSSASPDGALLASHYREAIKHNMLDFIAVTDHNTITFAQKLQREIGEQIIVGEEITALEGEIIGLYLDKAVPPDMSVKQTVEVIHSQGGLVYIPHPFETVRKGMPMSVLESIAGEVDIIEIHNGRALFQKRGGVARAWAARHDVPSASSSDAHGNHGWGKTYSLVDGKPTVKTLPALLKDAEYTIGTVGIIGVLYPKFNRLRKKVRRV